MSITTEQLKEIFNKVLSEIENLNVANLSYFEKKSLACDPKTSPEILAVLATDEDSLVRYLVARNPNTPPKVLEQLATDVEYWIRCCVAKHPNYEKATVRVPDLSVAEYNALKELLKNTQNQSLKSLSIKLGVIQ
jgi:hypothetical protein